MIKKGYNGNLNLRPVGVNVLYTEETIYEFEKCSKDPEYFITNYVKIVSLDDGIVPFDLFDYQKRFVKECFEKNKIVGMMPRQMGKCHHSDTKYTIRNKKTGEILSITAEQFHQLVKKDSINEENM